MASPPPTANSMIPTGSSSDKNESVSGASLTSSSTAAALRQPPQLPPGLKPLSQLNYFQQPPGSSTSTNPLLANGLPLPNLAALRPPSNITLPASLPKLTTNFNPLQPPPSLIRPPGVVGGNLLLNTATLDNKTAPVAAPTTPASAPQLPNVQNLLLNNSLPKFTPQPLVTATSSPNSTPVSLLPPTTRPVLFNNQTTNSQTPSPAPVWPTQNHEQLNGSVNMQQQAADSQPSNNETAHDESLGSNDTTNTTTSQSSSNDTTNSLGLESGLSTQAQNNAQFNVQNVPSVSNNIENNLFPPIKPQNQQPTNTFSPLVQPMMNQQQQPPVNSNQQQSQPFYSPNQTQFTSQPSNATPPPRFGAQAPTIQTQPQFFSPTSQTQTRPPQFNGPPPAVVQNQFPPVQTQPPNQSMIRQTFGQQQQQPTGISAPPMFGQQAPTAPPTFLQSPGSTNNAPPMFGQQPTAPPLGQTPNFGPPLAANSVQSGVRPAYKYPTPNSNAITQQPTDPSKPPNGPFPPPTANAQNSRPSSTLPPSAANQLTNQFGSMTVKGGQKPLALDLLQEKRLIPPYDDNTELIRPKFPHDFYTNVNCHPDIVRSTLTSIPESANLLAKCRLPLGILIHPFKDLESLKVVQSSTIVRCRNCRSYINPFVHFLDNTKWRCNLCYSVNDRKSLESHFKEDDFLKVLPIQVPDEFLFDPVTRTYGDPSKRPEINSSTIEFIAPAEYTLRPPPPAMYLFLLDVSHNAINTGYLQNACEILLECLDKLPGDTRTQIGFITYNSCIHFYNLSDSLSQPQMMIYPDIDDVSLPLPENLMINLLENKETIQTFLQDLPNLFHDTGDTESALGTALTAGFKMLSSTGGRVTVMQTCMPTCGVGSLKHRNDSIEKDAHAFAPQSDFYKKLALECAGVHIAVDLFMFNALYSDLATLSCISKYSGGEIKYYPEFHLEHYPEQSDRFCFDFKRYLTRKIGFEAVMRIRCTRGLSIHTFHGNFFVRSTDLLALPNVNPDAGFGMQISIDEALNDVTTVCFQAALLYTSSKGERRIRIHTYCLPVSNNLTDLINGADQEAIIGLVAKMAVDRTVMSSIKEAKDAMANVAIDYLNAYTQIMTKHQKGSLLTPYSLRLLPLYALALMKNMAFKYGSNIKIDDRVYMMNVYKAMPLKYLLLHIYPHLYAVHHIDDTKTVVDSETEICIPPRLHLSSESIDRHGVYILDVSESIYMWIGRSVNDQFLQQVFNVRSFNELPDHASELPELDNIVSERIRNFIVYLYDQRPFGASFLYFREDSVKSQLFFQHIHEDKTESSVSYMEFVRYLNDQVSKG